MRTPAGRLRGFVEDGITTFLGVPYAAPIMPERRFRAPEPVAPWTGVRSAERLSEVCPQVPTYGPVGTGATSGLASGTDFMTVNIRTPALDGAAPVLVWLHGGGYAAGSANEAVLQTGAFAASGIVEVTVNYRLGVLGFLHLDDAPANRGLLDQIAALTWVRDNIEAFGGDPRRVTLAGRSAGGFAVATLMAMPAAHGLFAGTLVQSGASPAVLMPDVARRVTQRILQAADLTVADLATVPIQRLLDAQKLVCDESYMHHDYARDGSVTMLGVALQPVIDRASLPEHPEAAAADGRLAPVPMMIGCTSAEYLVHSTMLPNIDFTQATRALDPRVRPLGLTGTTIVDRYRAALPEHSPKGIWRAVAGDLVFQNPTTRFAKLHARHQPVRKYLYGRIEPDETGARHGAEVDEVWSSGRHSANRKTGREVRHSAFAEIVHGTWASFVCDPIPQVYGGPSWAPFKEADPNVLCFREGSADFKDDPFLARVNLWAS